MSQNPSVIFVSDFSNGFAGWNTSNYANYTQYFAIQQSTPQNPAYYGNQYLQSTVTQSQINGATNLSAYIQYYLPTPSPILYWRLNVQYVGQSANPHHWLRVTGGTPSYANDGQANTVPPGNEGFWYNLDAYSTTTSTSIADTFFYYMVLVSNAFGLV
jgi:hypothetical protein